MSKKSGKIKSGNMTGYGTYNSIVFKIRRK